MSTASDRPVAYGRTPDASAEYKDRLRSLISQYGATAICDVGGGAYPSLPPEYVKQQGLDYVLLDVSAEELKKAPPGSTTLAMDVCAPDFEPPRTFDLVCSRMLAEHVQNPEAFHRNVYRLLRPGGVAFHFFPTLYSAPFVANRVLPEAVSQRIQHRLARRDSVAHAKFTAYYRWCRGPTRRQIDRFRRLGYSVELYKGFFGHRYWDGVPVVRVLHGRLTDLLLRFPVPQLTSYAQLVLRKN